MIVISGAQLDTARILREFNDRQRERGRFDFQRVAVDSAMAAGLVLVGWVSVKAGMGLYELSKAAVDPTGAVADSARGVEIALLRNQIRTLKRPVRRGARLQSEAGRATALAKAEEKLGVLMAVEHETIKADEAATPGLGMLKAADRMYGTWGPVLPAAVVGGNILMEFLRVRRERVGREVP